MTASDITELLVASGCLTLVLLSELALVNKVFWNGAHSRFLKLYLIMIITGTLFGLMWTAIRYVTQNGDKRSIIAIESTFIFLANLPLSLTYLLYACRIHNLADSVWSLQHAGAEGCFRKFRPLKILVTVLIVVV